MHFQNNVERAVDWIFSHPDDLGGDDEPEQQAADPSASSAGAGTSQNLTDGAPNYRLKAFISHMGNSHLVGHYVAHIHVEGKGWVIFNDEKVKQASFSCTQLTWNLPLYYICTL